MNTTQYVRIPTCLAPGHCDGYYIISNLPPAHPQANRLMPCACTRARQAAIIQAALPPALRQMTFEAFQVNDENRTAFNHARKFAQSPWGQNQFFLTLIGPNRKGKTHLAAAILNALLDRGEPALFENVPNLLDDLRNGYSDDSFYHQLERVKNAQVLVLDDLGAESSSSGQPFEVSWPHGKLYQVVDHRILHELPTVVTSNLTPDRLPQRIGSRLRDQHFAVMVALSTSNGQKR